MRKERKPSVTSKETADSMKAHTNELLKKERPGRPLTELDLAFNAGVAAAQKRAESVILRRK